MGNIFNLQDIGMGILKIIRGYYTNQIRYNQEFDIIAIDEERLAYYVKINERITRLEKSEVEIVRIDTVINNTIGQVVRAYSLSGIGKEKRNMLAEDNYNYLIQDISGGLILVGKKHYITC